MNGMKGNNLRVLQKTLLIIGDILTIILAAFLGYMGAEKGDLNLPIVGFWVLCNVTITVILFLLCGLYDIVFSSYGVSEIFKNIL